jgi:hypothetical protein
MAQATARIVYLQHPTLGVPAEARQVGYYREAGRTVGLELQFADGQRAKLRFTEIEALQLATEEDGSGFSAAAREKG